MLQPNLHPTKARNLFSLIAIQGANAILPLIIFPYTLYVFGSDTYQYIVYAEAVALFGVVFVLFGYDLFGVRELVSDNPRWAESDLFSIILASRILLFIISVVVGIIFITITNSSTLVYFVCWTPMILSFALQPNWYYQGIENNVFLSVCQIVSRAGIVLAVVFLPATVPGSTLPLIVSLGMLMGAVVSVWGACKIGNLRIKVPYFSWVMQSFYETWEIFLSAFSVTLFRSSNVILLSLFGLSSDVVAAYSLVEKLIKAVQAICRPLNQFFYPAVLRLCNNHKVPSKFLLKDIAPLIIPQLLVLAVLWVCLSAFFTIYIQSGGLSSIEPAQLHTSVKLVAIMVAATGFGILNFMLGTAALNAVGYQRVLLICILATGTISLGLNVLLIGRMGVTGAAIGYTCAEAVLFSLLVYVFMFRNNSPQNA